jgi:drug/metabolite transporter (DMT)-like permease
MNNHAVKSGNQALATLGLIFAIVIWAGSLIAMKIAVVELGALLTVFLRLLLASALLAFFVHKFEWRNIPRQDWGWLVIMALCEPCLYFVFEGLALEYTTASEAGMITAVQPLMFALAAAFFLKEQLTRQVLIGCVIAIAGVVVMNMNSQASETSPNPLLGNLLELGAMFFATIYCLIVRHIGSRYSPVFLTSIQTFVGTIFFLPLLALPSQSIPDSVSVDAVISILFLAWGVNILAFTFYNQALRELPTTQVASLLNLLPLMCLVFGWAFLGEQLTGIQYVGCGLLLLGIVVSQVKSVHKSLFFEQLLMPWQRVSNRIRAKVVG